MTISITVVENSQALTPFDQALNSARRYANASRASSTWRAYESDIARFQQWCTSVNRPSLPADTDTVAAFLASEADAGKAVSTIRRRLAAIRLLHIANDLPSPHESLQVTEVLQGIAREKRDRPVRQAKPALEADIKALVDAIDLTSLAGLRDRALLLVGFDSAMRRSELVGMDVEHIDRQDRGLLINIPSSKTDQTGFGQQTAVDSRAESPYCPVVALDVWLKAASIEKGAVFRRLYRQHRLGSERLGDRSVSLILKRRVKAAGFPNGAEKQFSGHSLRRGLITSVIKSGAPLLPVIHHARHKKTDSVIGYFQSVSLLHDHPGNMLFNK